jgi:hypothetical protein
MLPAANRRPQCRSVHVEVLGRERVIEGLFTVYDQISIMQNTMRREDYRHNATPVPLGLVGKEVTEMMHVYDIRSWEDA